MSRKNTQSVKILRKANIFAKNVAGWALFVFFYCLIKEVTSNANAQDSVDFDRYSRIEPRIINSRHKRAIENTLEKDGLHATYIQIAYEYKNKDVILDLILNDNLIPKGHFVSTQKPNGDLETNNFTKTDVDLCHYKGTIRNNPRSSVALSTCDGIRGVIFDGNETFSIENDGKSHDHFLIKHADLELDHKRENFNNTKRANLLNRVKRSAEDRNEIRAPYNSNSKSSYVELVIVVDNQVYHDFGRDERRIHRHCEDIANIINALYTPLNIFVILKGVVIWSRRDMIDISADGDVTLRNFLEYRRTELVRDHPNDNAQLLTGIQFNGGVVGKALMGPICTHEYSGGVSMNHNKLLTIVASTMAHEMGHNFGMEHDHDGCECPDRRCIMSSSSSYIAPTHWSSCSIEQLAHSIGHGMNSCLKNIPEQLFDSLTCGNGFVEPGEQCDCGFEQNCNNSCCNPHTCMLHSNASCATGSCCNLATCKPHTAGTKCREAFGECDLPEFCTGEGEFCPRDVFKRDTEECQDGKAFCYQGLCKTHDDQCKVLWGPSGMSSERQCYEKNTNGSLHGNCGYDRMQSRYLRCKQEDAVCGMLQCRHLNEKLEFGLDSASMQGSSYIGYGDSFLQCKTAIVDLGLETKDPGLTPDGAKCGENKMCVNQKCLPIEHLWHECPDCNGNGVCNTKGHCHCDDGWAPPFCNKPGPGGSLDSGPASDPSNHILARISYILCLGVLPCCLAFATLLRIFRKKLNRPSPSLYVTNISKNQKTPLKKISKNSISSGMFLSSTNPKLLSNSTDLLNVDLGEEV